MWTVASLVADLESADERPALVVVREGGAETLSAGELARRAQALARLLDDEGVAPGTPVLLYGPNSAAWIVSRLALGLLGALPVSIDDLSSVAEARRTVERFRCSLALVGRNHEAELTAAGLPEGCRCRTFEMLYALATDASRQTLAPAPPVAGADEDRAAMLAFSSGSTGNPKAFVLSDGNIAANVEALVSEGLIGPDDAVLLPLPLHHAYPQIVGLFTPLAAGAAVVLPEGIGGPQIRAAIAAADVTCLIGVPRLYTALADAIRGQLRRRGKAVAWFVERLLGASTAVKVRWGFSPGRALFGAARRRVGPRLRLLINGGARLDDEVLATLIGLGWEVRSGYGLAETASIMTGNLPGRERLGSEGQPFQGGEVRIADPDPSGLGEIELRGPNVFAGYTDPASANAEAFTPDGWLRTGDLGRLDGDGFLYVVGRVRELLVLGGGKKADPAELEDNYGASPFVAELAVLEREGSLVALVRPDEAAMRKAGHTRAGEVIRVFLTEQGRSLPSHLRLAGYQVVREPLPRTRLGKIRRFLLPEIYTRAEKSRGEPAAPRLSDTDEAFLDEGRRRVVWALLERRYPGRLTSLDDSLGLDLGVDSLEWMSLALELEDRLGVSLRDDVLSEIVTVRDLLQVVGDAAGARSPEAVPQALAEDAYPIPAAVARATARFLWGLDRLLMRAAFRLRVEGRPQPPATGPFVVIANHASDLDPLLLGAALPKPILARVCWGAAADRLPWTGWVGAILAEARVFPVDERSARRALAATAAVLDRGDGLVWFPESWRTPDGRLQAFLPGLAQVLEGRDVAVIPAHIAGSFEALPRTRRWPRLVPVTVRFGESESAKALEAAGAGETAVERLTEAMRARVAALAER